jgi:hypothetical protein
MERVMKVVEQESTATMMTALREVIEHKGTFLFAPSL